MVEHFPKILASKDKAATTTISFLKPSSEFNGRKCEMSNIPYSFQLIN